MPDIPPETVVELEGRIRAIESTDPIHWAAIEVGGMMMGTRPPTWEVTVPVSREKAEELRIGQDIAILVELGGERPEPEDIEQAPECKAGGCQFPEIGAPTYDHEEPIYVCEVGKCKVARAEGLRKGSDA